MRVVVISDSHGRSGVIDKILASQPDAKVVFFDERLTTAQAERVLLEGNVRRDKRKTVIDKLAATVILEAYLRTI